ncbi:MAG: hypothetical protein L6R35_004723 [Caloplaca aegaea]|nr:MAG: hypothetical protein L6R35_004723 [Caloplaca aegaea]
MKAFVKATVRRRNPKKQKSFAPYTPSSTSRSERGSVTSAVDDRPQNLAPSAAEGSSSEETFDNEPSGFEAEQYLSFFYTYKANKPSLSVFTQLAVSLVYDLGLNRPVPRDNPLVALCIQSHNTPMIPTPRTMEERRAVLGCFLITSM